MDRPEIFENELRIDTDYSPENIHEYILSFKDFIEEKDISVALKKMNRIRILCAVREGLQGVYALNQKIEKILAKECSADFDPSSEFYHNRPIMITRNDYLLELSNGDVGITRHIQENGHTGAYAFFEGDTAGCVKRVPTALLPDHETVFAMTIHKSQGSEFDQVVVVLPDNNPYGLLSRELFYTAITRAKSKVLVQSSESSLKDCFEKSVRRSSGIMERLSNLEKLNY